MIVRVALPIPVVRTFSYSVPAHWQPFVEPFCRVTVPFRTRTLTGFVMEVDSGDKAGLKELTEISDLFPLVSGALRELTDWASHYYVTPIGLVLKYAVPSERQIEKYLATSMEGDEGRDALPLKKTRAALGGDQVMDLFGRGMLEIRNLFDGRPFAPCRDAHLPGEPPQNRLFLGGHESRLAYYTALIQEALDQGKSVLMLLPDYYGTGSFFSRAFLERFPGRVLWYGGPAKAKARMETYFKVRKDGGWLILGHKSGVFLPAADLGLIIVERPEEDAYRNEEDFRFNAAVVAARRAETLGVPLVLGAMAPSVEVLKCVEEGRITLVDGDSRAPKERHETYLEKNIASYPDLPDGLMDIIREPLERRERVALFTPRRDYGGYLQCLECKTLFTCPQCSGVLSYRKLEESLFCPACGTKFPYEERCPRCGSSLIRFSRIGAEYLEERLGRAFPDTYITRITGETARKEIDRLRKLPQGIPALIIGTQALAGIYAQSVERLILVGWEELERTAGYRAHEKMFHLLAHLLDALKPEELYFCMELRRKVNPGPFLEALQFCRDEMERRRIAESPPYTRFFLVELTKGTEPAGNKAVAGIKEIMGAPEFSGEITGPLFQKKEKYQWRWIVKGSGGALYQSLLGLYDISGIRIEADPLYL